MKICDEILDGKIFIYPTDTVYGLGCNAEDAGAVEKIKEIKGRDKGKPLSVIAPSVEWIYEHCVIDVGDSGSDSRPNLVLKHSSPPLRKRENNSSPESSNILEKYLPGSYTLILKKKDKDFLSWVALGDSLGVRIPDCGFSKEVAKAGVPFITTSVNLSGEKPAVLLSDISEEIKNKVDVVIEAKEGALSGRPSSLVINGKVVER
tara:strand:- start:8412 stop:9026 length:615 start_codon:yes stop_codon:yes gene_type:complete